MDSGELAPFTGVNFGITRLDNVVGEPRVTNFEITTTLSSPDDELVLITDIYLMQVGRSVSRVLIQNPATTWGQTNQLLEAIFERMSQADLADAG